MRLFSQISFSFLFALSVSAQSSAGTSTASTRAASSSISSRVASSTSSSTKSSATAGSTPTTHRINVGQAGAHSFSDNSIFAPVGDIIQFVFYQSNHSVIRGEYFAADDCPNGYCNPCIPYEAIHGPSDLALFSGNQLVINTPSSSSTSPTDKVWKYTVTNASMPVWYYCNAINSCTPNGMVGVINPLESQSIDKQIASAKKAAYQLAPGEALPIEGASSTSASTSTPTSTSSASHPAHKSTLSAGAIAGIVIGALAILAIAAALFYFMGRSKTYKDMFASSRHGNGSEHPGVPQSEMGMSDRVGPWNPGPTGAAAAGAAPYQDNPNGSVSGLGSQDHRISQMTYNSVAQSNSGTFVGYNRNTGEPEFAAEVPADTGAAVYSAKTSPALKQGAWAAPQPSPGFVGGNPEAPVYEAPGDTPGRREKA
ncbi:hypothetical protein EG327_002158 [Venturia inaequalis]|uniref:Extracellular serine-rich protein n=1 Tax=Venturia inaequalis TaxID=5025 RepID=A0A8H3VL86_VENIN|nr:hypothetical protein EG327_002158 [Venturia inaequalis]